MPFAQRFLLASVLVSSTPLASALLGCKSVGGLVEPSPMSAREALGESTCRKVGERDQPLIVDWKPHERTDLEAAMHDGVAVVHYDCDGVRLLPGCQLDGSYQYLATSKKEQTIKLETADDIAANVPSLGKTFTGELSASLARGSTLNLAMVLIGKKRTTVAQATTAMLKDPKACVGATHFVRGAFVGAFALGTDTRGAVSTVAKVVKANSTSSTFSSYRDGDVAACSEGGVGPPTGCNGLVRVELVALGSKPVANAPGMDSSALSCPEGLAASQGKCTTPGSAGEPYECSGKDPFDCLAQCDRNDAASCVHLANLYLVGSRVAKDPTMAVPLLQKACDAAHPKGCGGLGFALANGLGVDKNPEKGAAFYQRACDAGNAEACSNLGVAFGDGKGVAKDESRAATLFRRACDGGEPYACFNLGVLAQAGRGQKADDALAAALFVRACQGDVAPACHNAGVYYKGGSGVSVNVQQAIGYFKRGCAGSDEKSCAELDEMKIPR
jgi:hypothetical protein